MIGKYERGEAAPCIEATMHVCAMFDAFIATTKFQGYLAVNK